MKRFFTIVLTFCAMFWSPFLVGQTITMDCTAGNSWGETVTALATTNQTILFDPATYTNLSGEGQIDKQTIAATNNGLTIDGQGSYLDLSGGSDIGFLALNGNDDITVKNLTIDGFNKTGGAGGISITKSTNITFENVHIANSTTGVAIVLDAQEGDVSVTFTDCTFDNNTVGLFDIYGDDGQVFTTNVTFNSCNFSCNANTTSGGAFRINSEGSSEDADATDNIITFNNCNFYKHSNSGDGGVINAEDCTLNFTGCDFVENTATGSGGVIFCQEQVNLTISGGIFAKNSAGDDGGAIATIAGGASSRNDLSITNTIFYENSSADEGGAFRLRHVNAAASPPMISGCLFFKNTIGDAASGTIDANNSAGNITLSQCTIADDNKAFADNPNVANSIIQDNGSIGAYADGGGNVTSGITFSNNYGSNGNIAEGANYDPTPANAAGTTLGVVSAVNTPAICPTVSAPAGTPCALLPVELHSFTAQARNHSTLLQWQTASEINNEGFELQKSATGKTWETLDFITGHGTTNESITYEYEDKRPFDGMNYYRLKQMDFDGQFEFSDVVTAEMKGNGSTIAVFPNPTKETLNIVINTPAENESEGTIQVFDIAGKVVLEKVADFESGANQLTVVVGNLHTGIYFVQIQYGNAATEMVRFVKN